MDTDNTDDKPQVMIQFIASIDDVKVSRRMPMRKVNAFALPRILGELLEQLGEKCKSETSKTISKVLGIKPQRKK